MSKRSLVFKLTIPEKNRTPISAPAVGLAEAVKLNVTPGTKHNALDLGETLVKNSIGRFRDTVGQSKYKTV